MLEAVEISGTTKTENPKKVTIEASKSWWRHVLTPPVWNVNKPRLSREAPYKLITHLSSEDEEAINSEIAQKLDEGKIIVFDFGEVIVIINGRENLLFQITPQERRQLTHSPEPIPIEAHQGQLSATITTSHGNISDTTLRSGETIFAKYTGLRNFYKSLDLEPPTDPTIYSVNHPTDPEPLATLLLQELDNQKRLVYKSQS